MNTKIFFILLAMAVFVLIALMFLSQRLGQPTLPLPPIERVLKKEQFQPPPPPSQPETLTGLDVAKRTTLFLDKTIQNDGTFWLFYNCDKKLAQVCLKSQPKEETPHSGMIVLAYLELFQKTGDASLKQKADRAMEVFTRQCQANGDFCEWNFFPFFVYFNQTKEQKYKDALLKVSDRFLKDQPLIKHLEGNHGPKQRILYQLTADKRYLDKLIAQTDALMAGVLDDHENNSLYYQEGGLAFRKQSQQIIWANVIPAYRATQNPKYLQFAQDFFDRAQLIKHYDDIKKQGKAYPLMLSLDNLLSLIELGSSPEANIVLARDLAQKIMAELWDSPKNRRYDGDYGWLKFFSETDNVKSTLTSGWLARLFIKMADQSFNF